MKSRFALYGALAVLAVLAVAVASPDSFAAFVQHAPAAIVAVGAAGAFGIVGDIQLVTSKELRAQRAELAETNHKLLAKIGAEKDQARVKELETEWDKRDDDILKLDKSIARAERQEQLDAEGSEPVHQRRSGRPNAAQADNPAGEREQTEEERIAQEKQYWRFLLNGLRYGMEALTPEARQTVQRRFQKVDQKELRAMEQRDGLSTTNASGGYGIPALFFNELQNSLLTFGGARKMARILTTDSGQSLPIPTVDDTANKAQIVSEGSSLTSPNDMTWGQVAVPTFMYRTIIPVTFELLQDSAFDLEAWIKEQCITRLGRGLNVHLTTGNGTTQPKGFIPGSSSGVTAASATSVSTDDLIDLEHSVDPAYRAGPSVGWQMKDSTLKVVKKLKDTQNRPLWITGFAVKEPSTIMGYPYVINQDMAAVQASNKSVAFGDWSKFLVRDVRSPLIVRANELYLTTGQVAFFLFSRHGSNVLDAGTDPIKHLTHPSPD